MNLDELLKSSAPSARPSLDRVRAAALAELRTGTPIAPWRRQLTVLLATTLGLAFVIAGVLLVTGDATVAQLVGHAPTLAVLMAACGLTATAAMQPHARGLRLAAFGGAGFAAFAIVALRGAGAPGASPEWLCTVSHLAAGLVPLAVAISLLRTSSPDPRRALLGGVAAGTVGAMLGELACVRGFTHVATYHLGAWALVAAASLLASRVLTPRSYAP